MSFPIMDSDPDLKNFKDKVVELCEMLPRYDHEQGGNVAASILSIMSVLDGALQGRVNLINKLMNLIELRSDKSPRKDDEYRLSDRDFEHIDKTIDRFYGPYAMGRDQATLARLGILYRELLGIIASERGAAIEKPI